MPSFNITKQVRINNSFRNQAVIGRHDIQVQNIKETFTGDIDLECEWEIGAIIGPSGTGKSTIIKEMFDYKDLKIDESKTPIELFNCNVAEAEEYLRNVGFSSPMSWVKPFHVLSNGERMRVELAYKMSLNEEPIIFDEFTSVVDRQIAKIGSFAVARTMRRHKKKFIAVSCHYDILEWLQPDWVFDTSDFSYKKTRGLLQRPKIKIDMVKKKGMWRYFSKHHYLSNKINPTADQYVFFRGEVPIAFCGVIHFPHPHAKNIKKITRIVVNPEWQGIGIAAKVFETICPIYTKRGFRVLITTSNSGLIKYFNRSKNWTLKRYGYRKRGKSCKNGIGVRAIVKTSTAEWVMGKSREV